MKHSVTIAEAYSAGTLVERGDFITTFDPKPS